MQVGKDRCFVWLLENYDHAVACVISNDGSEGLGGTISRPETRTIHFVRSCPASLLKSNVKDTVAPLKVCLRVA